MKKEFKAESKKLLDLMIHSIYTHKEIFLREIISNSSDAIDKLYYNSLNSDVKIDKSNLTIDIALDSEKRTIIISDNGIGMNQEELESNLGIIAKSGSLEFKENSKEENDIDIIGQFGVGFYSAFMVASKIEVLTKRHGDDAFKWTSTGEDGYDIEKSSKEENGTQITLYLRESDDNNDYDQYLKNSEIRSLIKKYSDYVRYPIRIEEVDEEGNSNFEVVNSMVPIWKKQKSEITDEEYNEFYTSTFYDFKEPQHVIHTNAEGVVSYNALIYIPSNVPGDFYNQNFQSSFRLYSKGVFIMDDYKEIIPEHFKFVRGLVDTEDVDLNISREILQNNHKLKLISKNLESKIKNELEKMLAKDRTRYEEFYENFGMQLKYGAYMDFGIHKEKLQNLLLFKSSFEEKFVTFDEYVNRMSKDQDAIYYASGSSIEKIKMIPQLEKIKEKYEVLYFTDEVDEFLVQILNTYKEKQFKSIAQSDLKLDDENIAELTSSNTDLIEKIKGSLKDEVEDVKLSSRLKSHPVCLVSGEGISMEMEKVLKSMPSSQEVKASKILEINPDHEMFNKLQSLSQSDIEKYSKMLYYQALLLEGHQIDNLSEFTELLNDFLLK